MGEGKAQRFGEAFLAVIKEYVSGEAPLKPGAAQVEEEPEEIPLPEPPPLPETPEPHRWTPAEDTALRKALQTLAEKIGVSEAEVLERLKENKF